VELCAEYSDDIPTLPNREDRYTEIMVDCYNVPALSSKGDERKGLLFEAKVRGRKQLVPAHEVYPIEQKGRNATVAPGISQG